MNDIDIRKQVMQIVKRNQKLFYKKFQKFVMSKPINEFSGRIDVDKLYTELMVEFVESITGGKQ